MKLKLILLAYLFVCFFCPKTSAQTLRDKQVQSLNLYVDYMNETIHALWILGNHLRNFNHTLNTYAGKNYDFSRSNYFGSPQSMKMILEDENWYYAVFPGKIYEQCVNDNILPAAHKAVLLKNLSDFREVIQKMVFTTDSIKNYVDNQLYKQDDSLKWAYQALERCSDEYDEFDVKKEILFTSLSGIYKQYYPSKFPTGQFQKTAPQWMEFMVLSKAVFEEVRYSKPADIDIEAETTELDTLLSRLKANQVQNLAGLKKYGTSHGLDPDGNYQHCIWDAEAIVSHCQSYLKAKEESPYYYGRSKQYHYYNEKFLNKYNRYGVGLVQAYNKFINLCSEPLLKMVEEPHWLEVLYPPKKKPEVETVNTTTQNQNNTFNLDNAAPNNMIFLLDVSGSMNSAEKFPLLKDAFKFLLNLMRSEDYVGIVTYSGTAKIAMNSTSAKFKKNIHAKIDSLYSGGSTNAEQGLNLAYQVANQNFIQNGNNTIILATDGDLELSKQTLKSIEKNAEKGIILTVFHLGKTEDEKVSHKLSKISSTGKGNFKHLTTENANAILVLEAKRFTKTK